MHQRGQYLPEWHLFKAHTEALTLFSTTGSQGSICSGVSKLKDINLIEKIIKLKQEASQQETNSRVFGSGKQLIGTIAEDFNEPLDDFKEYYR
jgi:hypothetical protein